MLLFSTMLLLASITFAVQTQQKEQTKNEKSCRYGKCEMLIRDGSYCGKCVETTGDKYCKKHTQKKQAQQQSKQRK